MYRKIGHIKDKMQKDLVGLGNIWFKKWSPKKNERQKFKAHG